MADHLQKSLKGLNDILPPIRKIYEESSCSPVYGVPLYEHLRITQQEICVPIQVCVKRMIEYGLMEEGLLRMAGSTTKIKRLKGLFDAGLISVDTTLEDYNRDYDVHVIAGAFKSYLRELPEPLLTHTKHDELIEAVRKQDHKEKLRHMWQVINALPAQNYTNLRYVIKFLSMLASHSGENKMTPNNIAIVMAPNLIGTQRETDNEIMALGRNMTLGNDYRVMVEQLIEYCDYFFKGELDFGVVPQRSEPPPSPKQTAANGTTQFTRTGSHRRTGSSDLSISVHPESESPKQPHRMKKKPAPLPPQGKGGWFDEAGQTYHPANHSPEPTRSKTPPASAILNSSTFPTPSPAPRLHHTNSIKRPTAEPPKPPSGTAPPVKPPRPSPPTIVSDTESKDPKPPRPCPPHAKEVKPEGIEGPPIGFENPDASNPTNPELGLGAPNAPVDEGALRQAPVIGFNVEGTRVRDKVRENEQLQEWTMRGGGDPEVKRGNGGGTDPEFRKSLEGVLKHQPQVHSRHLLRHSFVAEPSSGDPLQESKAPVQLPVFPVPAQRSSKEAASGDRPEPAPRSDKPAVPEKPSAINRSAGASDHPRPVIHDKPVVAVGSKPGSLSSLSTQGMSRSNEKLVETDVQGCDKESSSSKSEDALENDVNVVEKPSKPPKPSSVWAPIEGENATKAVNSDGGEDPKDSKRDPESKPVSGNLGSKPDSTNL